VEDRGDEISLDIYSTPVSLVADGSDSTVSYVPLTQKSSSAESLSSNTSNQCSSSNYSPLQTNKPRRSKSFNLFSGSPFSRSPTHSQVLHKTKTVTLHPLNIKFLKDLYGPLASELSHSGDHQTSAFVGLETWLNPDETLSGSEHSENESDTSDCLMESPTKEGHHDADSNKELDREVINEVIKHDTLCPVSRRKVTKSSTFPNKLLTATKNKSKLFPSILQQYIKIRQRNLISNRINSESPKLIETRFVENLSKTYTQISSSGPQMNKSPLKRNSFEVDPIGTLKYFMRHKECKFYGGKFLRQSSSSSEHLDPSVSQPIKKTLRKNVSFVQSVQIHNETATRPKECQRKSVVSRKVSTIHNNSNCNSKKVSKCYNIIEGIAVHSKKPEGDLSKKKENVFTESIENQLSKVALQVDVCESKEINALKPKKPSINLSDSSSSSQLSSEYQKLFAQSYTLMKRRKVESLEILKSRSSQKNSDESGSSSPIPEEDNSNTIRYAILPSSQNEDNVQKSAKRCILPSKPPVSSKNEVQSSTSSSRTSSPEIKNQNIQSPTAASVESFSSNFPKLQVCSKGGSWWALNAAVLQFYRKLYHEGRCLQVHAEVIQWTKVSIICYSKYNEFI